MAIEGIGMLGPSRIAAGLGRGGAATGAGTGWVAGLGAAGAAGVGAAAGLALPALRHADRVA